MSSPLTCLPGCIRHLLIHHNLEQTWSEVGIVMDLTAEDHHQKQYTRMYMYVDILYMHLENTCTCICVCTLYMYMYINPLVRTQRERQGTGSYGRRPGYMTGCLMVFTVYGICTAQGQYYPMHCKNHETLTCTDRP